jgi:hypothetical protein
LQYNQLSNKSAKKALEILAQNKDILLFDLRNNNIGKLMTLLDLAITDLIHTAVSINIKQRDAVNGEVKVDPDLIPMDAHDPLKPLYYEDERYFGNSKNAERLRMEHRKQGKMRTTPSSGNPKRIDIKTKEKTRTKRVFEKTNCIRNHKPGVIQNKPSLPRRPILPKVIVINKPEAEQTIKLNKTTEHKPCTCQANHDLQSNCLLNENRKYKKRIEELEELVKVLIQDRQLNSRLIDQTTTIPNQSAMERNLESKLIGIPFTGDIKPIIKHSTMDENCLNTHHQLTLKNENPNTIMNCKNELIELCGIMRSEPSSMEQLLQLIEISIQSFNKTLDALENKIH